LEPRFIHVMETGSTNQLIQMISAGEFLASGSIVLADFQTAGRGVSGSSWESEAGKNLTFSVIYYPEDVPVNRVFAISEMVSLSIKCTLDRYISGVTVKWPNDIYCGDKKITGILIENKLSPAKVTQSIIGIGINVNQTTFLSDAPNPISMAMVAGNAFNCLNIMNDFRKAFAEQSERLNNLHFDSIHYDYLEATYRKNGFYPYCDAHGSFEAVIRDIEPSGHLILERTNGIISRYTFKEVSYQL